VVGGPIQMSAPDLAPPQQRPTESIAQRNNCIDQTEPPLHFKLMM
jgi:hypothetical protein